MNQPLLARRIFARYQSMWNDFGITGEGDDAQWHRQGRAVNARGVEGDGASARADGWIGVTLVGENVTCRRRFSAGGLRTSRRRPRAAIAASTHQ